MNHSTQPKDSDSPSEKMTSPVENPDPLHPKIESDQHHCPDGLLFERTHNQWQAGDWRNLIRIDPASYQNHPDRAKIALLIANAYMQIGQLAEVGHYIRMAEDWGATKERIGQVMIGGLYNSLGRTAAACGEMQTAQQYFIQALAIALPGCDVTIPTQIRCRHQLEDLGLWPGVEGRLQEYKAQNHPEEDHRVASASSSPDVAQPNHESALAFYQDLSNHQAPETLPLFTLIDSKSLPRSGLHFLKNTLQRLLGEHFSFCEWYQDVGCCRQRPCALTGFAQHAHRTGQFRIRLIKSHDFELTDEKIETSAVLQRLILVRDPLFTLTSWFELDRLGAYRDVLLQHGIHIQKLWLTHERELLETAYRVLEDCFVAPSTDELIKWLRQKGNYIAGFMNSWVKPAMENPSPHVHVVAYDEMQSFVTKTALPYRDYLSDTARKRLDDYANSADVLFQKRKSPFSVRVASVAEFINNQASHFEEAAHRVRTNDQSGYFSARYVEYK